MKHLLAAGLAAIALLGAAPAWAHEEISPASVPTGIPMFLSFSVANEKPVDMTTIRLVTPRDMAFGPTTREPPGWTAAKSSAAVTWTGALEPAKFETFGFETESANQPGNKTYTVTLTYADNSTDNADVTLTVTPAVTGAGDGAAAPTGGGGSGGGGDGGGSGGGMAAAALALGAAALALALGAFARSRKPASATAGAGAGAKEDW